MRKTRNRMYRVGGTVGGTVGSLSRILYLNNATVLGAGGYGLVVNPNPKKTKEVFKLFFDLDACKKVADEASIQQKAHTIFKRLVPEVGIPSITYHTNQILSYNGKNYLCGIGMEYLPPPTKQGFDETVHMLLGYHNDDIDSSWGQLQSIPVSPTNPTRGFFASPDMMEMIWADDGSELTIDRVAALMGKSYRVLLENGIIPIDVEWVYSQGKPWIIDFGLCELRTIQPIDFLRANGSSGLGSDFYVPHEGDRGYESFMKEFLF